MTLTIDQYAAMIQETNLKMLNDPVQLLGLIKHNEPARKSIFKTLACFEPSTSALLISPDYSQGAFCIDMTHHGIKVFNWIPQWLLTYILLDDVYDQFETDWIPKDTLALSPLMCMLHKVPVDLYVYTDGGNRTNITIENIDACVTDQTSLDAMEYVQEELKMVFRIHSKSWWKFKVTIGFKTSYEIIFRWNYSEKKITNFSISKDRKTLSDSIIGAKLLAVKSWFENDWALLGTSSLTRIKDLDIDGHHFLFPLILRLYLRD